MANKLINPINKFVDKTPVDMPKGLDEIPLGYFGTVSEYAKSFIGGMGEEQRMRFKQMLDSGIEAGKSVAEVYGIDPKEFMKAVKSILNKGD